MQTPAKQMEAATVPSKPANAKQPDIASASVPETLTALHVNPDAGLTAGEVETRRHQHGYNEVAELVEHPVLKFLGKFWGLSAWMLELIMLLSLVLRHYSDLAIVGGLLLINAVLGFAQEQRAAGVMQTLRRRLQVSGGCCATPTGRSFPPASWCRVTLSACVPAMSCRRMSRS